MQLNLQHVVRRVTCYTESSLSAQADDDQCPTYHNHYTMSQQIIIITLQKLYT